MKFIDKVKKMVDEAPVATGGGANVNFGSMTVMPIIIRWKGRGQKPDKYTLPEYVKEFGLKNEEEIELEEGKESFQLAFDIDITEINPALDFHFQREIDIKVSNKTNKDPNKWLLTSWSEIVQPSLVKVFGKEWEDKLISNGKSSPTVYVAAEAVEAIEPPKGDKKPYKVPKFIGVYKTLEECKAAHDLRYPPRDAEAEMTFGPDDEEEVEAGEEEVEEGDIPADVIKQVVTLYNSNVKNKKRTKKMLEGNPFGNYDPDELLEAAGIE
jgi:hypothetical protein